MLQLANVAFAHISFTLAVLLVSGKGILANNSSGILKSKFGNSSNNVGTTAGSSLNVETFEASKCFASCSEKSIDLVLVYISMSVHGPKTSLTFCT